MKRISHGFVFLFFLMFATTSMTEVVEADPKSISPEEAIEKVRQAVGAEFGMDDPVVSIPWQVDEYTEVAYNGTNYLVVWHDFRSFKSYDIWGCRVGAAGVVLDPYGIPISTAHSDQLYATVASNGADFFVAWYDERGGKEDIWGARVSGLDGAVLDPDGIHVCDAEEGQEMPSAASDGVDYIVAWQDYRNMGVGNMYDVYGARVAASDGAVLDPDGIALSTEVLFQFFPDVASDGTSYLVVWMDYRNPGGMDIYGTRVDPADGSVLDPAGIQIWPELCSLPKVASNGTDYLVAWNDERALDDYNIYGARVDGTDGSVLDPAGIPICMAVEDQSHPAVASDGIDYLVAWHDRRNGSTDNDEIYGARVSSTDGSVLDPDGIAICTAPWMQRQAAVASDGTNYLVVWNDERIAFDIFGARVEAATGDVLDAEGIPVGTSANGQAQPAVAFNGENYLVVWEDYRTPLASSWDIYGCRVDAATGAVLDPGGIPICTAEHWHFFPAVATDGTDYLVTWIDYRNIAVSGQDIYAARIDGSDGTVLDPDGIPICTVDEAQTFPSAAFQGEHYLVVWMDRREFPDGYDLYGTLVDPDDGSMPWWEETAISAKAQTDMFPDVISDGTQWFVTWRYGNNFYDILGTRVRLTPDGYLDKIDMPLGIPICTEASNQERPVVAFDGTAFLAVWEDERNLATTGFDIYGARIVENPDDSVSLPDSPDGFTVSTAAGDQDRLDVASDGTGFLVAWNDLRDEATESSDIYGTRVKLNPDASVEVVDPDGFPIAATIDREVDPSLVVDGSDYLLAYSRFDEGLGAFRARGRFVEASVCHDADGDGFGFPGAPACGDPTEDCDDADPEINPGVLEAKGAGNCEDGIDNDCDGLADTDPECGGCFIYLMM